MYNNQPLFSNAIMHMINNRIQTSLLLLTFFTVIFPGPVVYAQESEIVKGTIYVDDVAVETEIISKDDHIMVPSLFLKNTGASVDWYQDHQSMAFNLNSTHVTVLPEKSLINVTDSDLETQSKTLPVIPIYVEGQLFIPLECVAESLGLEVVHDEEDHVSIQNPVERETERIGSTNPKNMQVALTFDDGPEATYTPQILDILQDKEISATFFVVGKQVELYPEIMRRIVDEGHSLGNHSYSHASFPSITTSQVFQELKKTQLAIEKIVGTKPNLLRPPYGALSRGDEELASEKGFRIVTWSVDTLDWTGASADEIFSTVSKEIEAGGITLQHNSDSNPGKLDGTIEALPRIIDDLQSRGYTFVTVESLLDEKNQNIKKESDF
ncbi:polysaccharide deacetylase family protein [Salipaludibacillus neizhouensis]|nr:polysaccharide deacetylase family protein [Salipaludibacillus neizhouensis]